MSFPLSLVMSSHVASAVFHNVKTSETADPGTTDIMYVLVTYDVSCQLREIHADPERARAALEKWCHEHDVAPGSIAYLVFAVPCQRYRGRLCVTMLDHEGVAFPAVEGTRIVRVHAPNARNALGPRGAMAWIRYLLPFNSNDPPVFELRTDSLKHFNGVWFSSRAHQEREEPGVQGTFRVVDDGNLAIHWDSVRPINDGGDRNDRRKRRRLEEGAGGDGGARRTGAAATT